MEDSRLYLVEIMVSHLNSDYPYSIYGANSNDFSIKDDSTKFYWEENSQDSSAMIRRQTKPDSSQPSLKD